jgi:hypothetical protein
MNMQERSLSGAAAHLNFCTESDAAIVFFRATTRAWHNFRRNMQLGAVCAGLIVRTCVEDMVVFKPEWERGYFGNCLSCGMHAN